ncbi:hypothetical protein SFRURICE_006183, partial [Spodoptera frugiperda]
VKFKLQLYSNFFSTTPFIPVGVDRNEHVQCNAAIQCTPTFFLNGIQETMSTKGSYFNQCIRNTWVKMGPNSIKISLYSPYVHSIPFLVVLSTYPLFTSPMLHVTTEFFLNRKKSSNTFPDSRIEPDTLPVALATTRITK